MTFSRLSNNSCDEPNGRWTNETSNIGQSEEPNFDTRQNPVSKFTSASQLAMKEWEQNKFPSFSVGLNHMLHGGIDFRAITEFYGPPGCGKTQMCHSLAVAALAGKKTSKSIVLYIDTQRTFNIRRIFELAAWRQFDVDIILNCIKVQGADSVSEQEETVHSLSAFLKTNHVVLIVVDSVIQNYRTEFPGRADLIERQKRLLKYMQTLSTLAFNYCTAVVITNQVTSRPDKKNSYIPTGGNILGHSVTHRISLTPLGQYILARLEKSAYYPPNRCKLEITRMGIEDADS